MRAPALALAGALALAPLAPARAVSPTAIKGLVELLQAAPKSRGIQRAAALLEESTALMKAGDDEAAISRLEAAAAALREDDTPKSRQLAEGVDRTVAEMRAWRAMDRAWRDADAAMRQQGDPTDAQAAARGSDLSPLPAARAPVVAQVVTALRDARPAPPRVMWVAPAVRRFAADFEAGVARSQSTLRAARAGHAARVDRWLATPPDKRIFVIGAGRDAERIAAAAAALEPKGYVVFFYDFCVRATGSLCDSRTVGAFFATAGHAVLIDTAEAAASRFVAVETALARRAQGHGVRVLVVAPVEVALHTFRGGRIWALQVESDDR